MARGPIKQESPKATTRAERTRSRKSVEKVAHKFEAFRPAREVLRSVAFVPTIFAQFDHATGVGGLPIERFMLLHGPSNHGKTQFLLGLIRSFLERGHYAGLVDAEHTTPWEWVETLVGADLANRTSDEERFTALRPDTYEETVDAVRDFARKIGRWREEGKIAPDTTAILGVDSIRKLVPKNLLAKILQGADKHGLDGVGGRGAQIKAAMNAAWLDELTPLLARTRVAMVVIAREAEDPDADASARKWGAAYKVGGGRAIYYDASLVMRCERAAWVYERKKEEGETLPAIGERIRVTIKKTKVAGKEDREERAYFHTSNGTLVPEGFDRPRDLIELGRALGIVEARGTWLDLGVSGAVAQGEMNAVKRLHSDEDLFRAFEQRIRERMKEVGLGDGVTVED